MIFDPNKRRTKEEQIKYDRRTNWCKKYYIWQVYDVIDTIWIAFYLLVWFILHSIARYLYNRNILRSILRDQSNEYIVHYLVDFRKHTE